jgi:hypothetical protein
MSVWKDARYSFGQAETGGGFSTTGGNRNSVRVNQLCNAGVSSDWVAGDIFLTANPLLRIDSSSRPFCIYFFALNYHDPNSRTFFSFFFPIRTFAFSLRAYRYLYRSWLSAHVHRGSKHDFIGRRYSGFVYASRGYTLWAQGFDCSCM